MEFVEYSQHAIAIHVSTQNLRICRVRKRYQILHVLHKRSRMSFIIYLLAWRRYSILQYWIFNTRYTCMHAQCSYNQPVWHRMPYWISVHCMPYSSTGYNTYLFQYCHMDWYMDTGTRKYCIPVPVFLVLILTIHVLQYVHVYRYHASSALAYRYCNTSTRVPRVGTLYTWTGNCCIAIPVPGIVAACYYNTME